MLFQHLVMQNGLAKNLEYGLHEPRFTGVYFLNIYFLRPTPMQTVKDVVAAVLIKDNKILIAQRASDDPLPFITLRSWR